MSERGRVKKIWQGKARRSLSRDRQKPEGERARHRVISTVNERGKDLTPELENIINCLQFLKPVNVLDIGTGYGMMAKWLTQNGLLPGLDYTACDWLDDYLDLHEENTGIRPIKWDGITLPFDADSFGFVMAYSVLLHVPPGNLIQFFREMTRVSRQWIYIHTARPFEIQGTTDFSHDYARLFKAFGANIITEVESIDGRRVNWLLQVGNGWRLATELRLLMSSGKL